MSYKYIKITATVIILGATGLLIKTAQPTQLLEAEATQSPAPIKPFTFAVQPERTELAHESKPRTLDLHEAATLEATDIQSSNVPPIISPEIASQELASHQFASVEPPGTFSASPATGTPASSGSFSSSPTTSASGSSGLGGSSGGTGGSGSSGGGSAGGGASGESGSLGDLSGSPDSDSTLPAAPLDIEEPTLLPGGGLASGGTQDDTEETDGTSNLATSKLNFSGLPELNRLYSPLSSNNREALFARLTKAFDQYYETNYPASRNLADHYVFYYLRQELQALLDMFYATDEIRYLETARDLSLEAIQDATANSRPLIYNGKERGTWPCFLHRDLLDKTGGHSQLIDFQGAAGLMMVAQTLRDNEISDWSEIADFVEAKIIEKWLYFNPDRHTVHYTGTHSINYLIGALDGARDKREHFAGICLHLSQLDYTKYPYQEWAQFLFQVYLGERTSLSQAFPDPRYRTLVPTDWGLYEKNNGTFVWYWTGRHTIQDTSHANRTVWYGVEAQESGLLETDLIGGLVQTFKRNIWTPANGPFYFKNYIDGSDPAIQSMEPGRKGNVWFGWHRLAAYDAELKVLFLSMAYDLTKGASNFPPLAQNVRMKNAPLCLIAWGARLAKQDISQQL